MKIYVYVDESGSIHKNSKTRFFAVGGYFVFEKDKCKITSRYKQLNKAIKLRRNIPIDKEVKSYDMSQQDKIDIFKYVQDIDSFYGCAKIFEKHNMRKEVVESNIFFNYAVKLLFIDCIIPLLNFEENANIVEFVVSVDNRNIRVGELDNLETYLRTEFCLYNFDFKVKYYDSASNYGIQLADLIVNTFYNYHKDKTIVDKVYPTLKLKNFRTSVFPGDKISGRTQKISCNA